MQSLRLRRAFGMMYFTLGLAVLADSLRTMLAAVAGSPEPNMHLAVLAAVEAGGATLFLLPRSTRLGALVMLATLGVAIVAHLVRAEVPTPLFVYAAATVFVLVHGSVWGSARVRASETA